VIAPAVISNGHVIVRTIDGRITAYAETDGQQQWQFTRPVPALSLRSHASVTAMGGLVFSGLANGQVVALIEENGGIAWEGQVAIAHGTTELERAVDILGRPIVIGQQVCAVAYQGRVTCFVGGNGSPIWSRDLSSVTELASDGHLIFAVDIQGNLSAFNAHNGQQSWKLEQLAGRKLSAPAVLGRYVVFGDQEGYVYFVDKETGSIEAIKRVSKTPIWQKPTIYNDNVIIKTSKGNLFALGV
jgi:outer membrane protein assembly factor BamB